MYIRAKGPEVSIPQICFWIEIVANLGNFLTAGIVFLHVNINEIFTPLFRENDLPRGRSAVGEKYFSSSGW